MPLKTEPFDAAEYIESGEDAAEFLKAAFETNDPAYMAKAIGTVARARNMSKLARDVGMSRAALYTALSGQGNPEFATIVKIMDALGLAITPTARDKSKSAA